jgi:hypothetical protein
MVALLAISAPVSAGTPPAVCSPATMGWTSLTHSGGAIPYFMFGADLEVSRVAVCDDGVFFYFGTRSQGSYSQFCLGFLRPTQEAVAEFMGTELTDPTGKAISILEATAFAIENYELFRDQLVDVLGHRYAFGTPVSFTRERWKATLHIEFGTPFVFTYRKREASIQTGVFDVFAEPRHEGPHPVLLMMMLMPR